MPSSAVLFLSLFAAQAAILVLSPILPQVAADLGVTTAAAAQLRSVSGITAGGVALILVGRGDRFRLDRLLAVGLAVLGAGSVASALAPTFAALVAVQAGIGIGLALVLSGGLAASEAWAASGGGAHLLSWALIGQPVAWIVGQPVVGLVAEHGWRWTWIAVPLLASLVALAAVGAAEPEARTRGPRCRPLNLWKQPGIRGWAIGELLAFSAWAGALVYAGAFFITTYGAGVALTGTILGLGAAAYLPGNFLGRRWLKGDSGRILVASSAGAAAGVVAFGGVHVGLVTSALIFAALTFIAAARTIAGAALGLQLANGRRLDAMSIRTAMIQFGYLLGTALGGIVLPRWGFAGLGAAFGVLFVTAALLPVPALVRARMARPGRQILRRSPDS